MKELGKWTPFFRVVQLNPKLEVREEIIKNELVEGKFDICLTTYEGISICFGALNKFKWQYMIVDEAHKLKNKDSKISIFSRRINTRNRLLLTGTPLQNNLLELWALLNFMMPSVFSSDEDFKQWFDFGNEADGKKAKNKSSSKDQVMEEEVDEKEEAEEKDRNLELVESLHKIMRPFLLRRAKADLATKLPDKIEIIVNTSMSAMQFDIYEKLLKSQNIFSDTSGKKTNSRQLNNLLMQLRKACQHPYLFDGAEPDGADEYGEHIVENCGKLKFVDRLLKHIFQKKEQVLLFSNFTSFLDILEDYCQMRGYKFCRLDGSTELEDRDHAIKEFTKPDSDIYLFMLSTRAGGLGINLMTANHVILYDSDWNPQVDLQAMDRAHRIGQKKKVYVYRLITKSTVEEKILERQAIRLKLDQIVIQSGKVASQKTLTKEEYEKILIHGAAEILQQKQQILSDDGLADVEAIIEEGEKKFAQLKEEAAKQAEKLKNAFNFEVEATDMLLFQDKDYREERKKVQHIIVQKQEE